MFRFASHGLAAALLLASPAFAHDLCDEADRIAAKPMVMAQATQSNAHGSHGAAPATQGAIRLEQPWTRATPGGASVAGGYVKITNAGSTPDRLVGGAFTIAKRFEIHEMATIDGVMKMRHLPQGIALAPGESVELKPGSYHMMLMELTGPIKAGDRIKGTLVFEKAGKMEVELVAAPAGASKPGGHMQH